MPKKDFHFAHKLRVRWSECDAQGILLNAQYINLIEVAHAEYFRNLGILIFDPDSRRDFDLATVQANLQYLAPARVDEIIEIRIRVSDMGNSSLTLSAEIYAERGEQPIHRAELVYVNYDAAAGKSRPIPDRARRLITDFERGSDAPP